jgi:uncharacterized protein (DUF1015 family)
MADVAPLDPLRYDASLLSRVVAPPYDVIDAELRKTLGDRHANNVVHIDLPAGDGDEKYANAERLFRRWQSEGVLKRDGKPAFWRYVQTFDPPGGGSRLSRKGFFGLVRVAPYSARIVMPHERTLTGPKRDRHELSLTTRATLSPGFMLYSDPEHALEADLDSGELFADFETEDGIRHQLWRVSSARAVVRIANALADSSLLIADGHHRYETALTLAGELDVEATERGQKVSERSEHHYFPVLLANGDDPGLVVFPTHRLIHSLPRFDFGELLVKAEEVFAVTPASGTPEDLGRVLDGAPRASICAVAPDGRAALLVARSDVDLGAHPVLGKRPAVVRHTGVALLHDGLLEHVLGISPEAQAAKTNIVYLQDARRGIASLTEGAGQVLFLMKATPVSVIRAVAEAGEVMPQKSTYFYPKVPTGLLFHTLDPARVVS